MLFSLLKHYLDTDTALKVSQSVYCFTTSISYGVENYFPRLWGTGISDAVFGIIIMRHENIFFTGTNITFDMYQGCTLSRFFLYFFSSDFLRRYSNCIILWIHKIWQALS